MCLFAHFSVSSRQKRSSNKRRHLCLIWLYPQHLAHRRGLIDLWSVSCKGTCGISRLLWARMPAPMREVKACFRRLPLPALAPRPSLCQARGTLWLPGAPLAAAASWLCYDACVLGFLPYTSRCSLEWIRLANLHRRWAVQNAITVLEMKVIFWR